MKRTSRAKAPQDTPVLEWMVGSVGAVLFLLGVGFLVAEGLQGDDNPGRIEFKVQEVAQAGDAFYVRYSAHNLGSLTLADLNVRAELFQGEVVVETSHGKLEFLPGQSSRIGGFFFRRDPRTLNLVLSAEGYQEP